MSERCPSSEINSTWRFERCVQQQMQALRLSATLREHYCHSATTTLLPLDSSQRMFLTVIAVLLCLNFFGTIYDFATGTNGSKYYMSKRTLVKDLILSKSLRDLSSFCESGIILLSLQNIYL